MAIAHYSKRIRSDFIIIPQNGEELVFDNGMNPVTGYLNAISGLGKEELFYGYNGMNTKTPEYLRDEWIGYLDFAKTQGKAILVTDYCYDTVLIDSSYMLNNQQGYVSFAADSRELDRVPSYPTVPFNMNEDSVTSLNKARNFLYLINPENFATKEEYLNSLSRKDFDLLIIDAFYRGNILTSEDLTLLKQKSNGARRLVIAYVSIGEAENYRYYWKDNWYSNPPSYLCEENPEWPGNYAVKYWDSRWQSIIFGNDSSYIKKIIDAGFDGVYLDKVDEYEYFEEKGCQ